MTSEKASKRPLHRDQLETLIAGGVISPENEGGVDGLRAQFRESIGWSQWVGRWALGLGAVFFACGVVFFFAYNWKYLSPLARFAALEGGVVAAVIAALAVGIGKPAGQWLLLGACVVAGVLMAVFGQVYQTGADAFEVFALWAVLTIGWVLVSRFAPLWLLWLVIAETAIALFWGQVVVPDGRGGWAGVYIALGSLTLAFAVLRTWLVSDDSEERFAWMGGAWLRIVLLAATLVWLSFPPIMLIVEAGKDVERPVQWLGTLLWMGALGLGGWFYFVVRPSVTALGVCALAFGVVLTFAVVRGLIEADWDSAGAWLMTGILVIVIFGGVGMLVTKAGRMIRDRESGAAGKVSQATGPSGES